MPQLPQAALLLAAAVYVGHILAACRTPFGVMALSIKTRPIFVATDLPPAPVEQLGYKEHHVR